ncbi:MAG TPA: glycoside hydrolase family 3 N-terminal domain-containing protein [Methylomirabilota bacterium]|nr:glycoside hydrolase family 3 N-terminal domain-containing protein [Methylomirabilota bacterium]
MAKPRRLPLGDLLLVGFHGTTLEGNEELRALICDVRVGGLILFERDTASRGPRNIVDPEQLARLTADVQALARRCAGRPLLIAIDAEGGSVMRLTLRAGYPPAPSAQDMGERDDPALTREEARRLGARLREAGINWNLAPVVDVAVNPGNPAVVALGRTFGSDPGMVTAHARAFILGMHEAGVLTALKHFPGHGSSLSDSHHGFTDVTDTARLDVELAPFQELVREHLADAVMPAHVFNRHLDTWHPASLSWYTVRRLLRGKLGFQGVVVSDDLLMGAITQHYGLEEAALLALGAGVDVLLVSENTIRREPRGAARVVGAIQRALDEGRITRGAVQTALRRVAALRARIPWP